MCLSKGIISGGTWYVLVIGGINFDRAVRPCFIFFCHIIPLLQLISNLWRDHLRPCKCPFFIEMSVPHQKSPFDLASIDVLFSFFLWWLQNNDFLSIAVSPYLLDDCWHFSVSKRWLRFLFIDFLLMWTHEFLFFQCFIIRNYMIIFLHMFFHIWLVSSFKLASGSLWYAAVIFGEHFFFFLPHKMSLAYL